MVQRATEAGAPQNDIDWLERPVLPFDTGFGDFAEHRAAIQDATRLGRT